MTSMDEPDPAAQEPELQRLSIEIGKPMNGTRGKRGLSLVSLLLLFLFAVIALPAHAACSAWRSPDKVWFNEYFFGGGAGAPPNFLELYSTSNAFPALWQGLYVEVYSAANTKTTYTFNNTTATACTIANKTWVTRNVPGGLRQQNTLAILREANGDAIDAFVFDNGSPPAPWASAANNWAPGHTTGCSALDTALSTQAGLSGTTPKQANMLVLPNFGNKDMARDPDGGPIWDLTSNTGAGTTYTRCVSNNANFTKTVDNATPSPGSTITFTLSIANTGSSALAGVTLDDFLPDYLPSGSPTFISAIPVNGLDSVTTSTYATTDPNTGTPGNSTKITWAPASIAAGTTARLNIKMQVPINATTGFSYTNTAQTTGTALSPNQTDYASITIGTLNVGSFAISVSPATASTCTTALLGPKVTITAMTGPNGTGSVNTTYQNTASNAVTLTASTPNPRWYNSAGTLLATVAPVPVNSFTAGVATFYLTDATAEAFTVSALDVVTYSPSVMQGTSGNITFTSGATGLVLIDADTLSPAYGVVAGRLHRVRATISSCGATNTSATGTYSGTIKYTAGLNHPAGSDAPAYNTAASCPGTTLTTTGGPASIAFTSGVAYFYLCTSDVGQYALNLTLTNVPQGQQTVTVTGNSGNFTVRPFVITATGFAAGATTNPQGASPFVSAGSPFSGTFDAWKWRSNEDPDNNGIPDTGVTAASFSVATHGRPLRFSGTTNNAGVVTVDPKLNIPASGTLGTFAPTTATASSGTVTVTNLFSYSEVGSITIAGPAGGLYGATDYLGMSGLHVPILSDVVGRFVPAYLETSVSPACGAGPTTFTYSGQPFVTTVTAKNLAGIKTNNYSAAGVAQNVTLAAVGATGTITGGDAGPADRFLPVHFTSGTGLLAPTFSFSATPSDPVVMTLRATDADTVSSVGHEGTGVEIRSGRVRLENANGSELLNLPLTLKLQYWAGDETKTPSGWQVNSADTCTPTITAANFAFSFPTPGNGLSACKTAITVVSGSAPNYTLTLTRPGAGNTGWAEVTLNLGATASGNQCTAIGGAGAFATTVDAPWLQYNWTGSVANPKARATFGLFKSGPVIFRREMH